jgi:RNA polymerase sigma-70 factor (ECF subfamily)
MEDDWEVIRRVKSGVVADFRLLVEKYHRHLLNFIYGIVSDESIVEDIGQDVFLAAFLSLKTFDESRGTPFSAWLFTIARNKCFSAMRKRKGRRRSDVYDPDSLADNSYNPENRMIAAERKYALEKSAGLLPEPFRSVLLDSLGGATIKQVSEIHRVSEGTVKTRLFRARERLKKMLGTPKKGLFL